jgi:AcrR family transcriptional regulator
VKQTKSLDRSDSSLDASVRLGIELASKQQGVQGPAAVQDRPVSGLLESTLMEPPTVDHGRNTPSRQRRLAEIIDAATRLFERKGYHATTMHEIARKAGISAGLIYSYAANKEEVLLLTIVDILEGYERDLPPAIAAHNDPVERLIAGFRAYCQVVGRRRHGAVLAYRESNTLSRAGRDRLKRLELRTTMLLADVIREGVRQGVFVDADPELAAYDFMILAHGWALKYWYLSETRTLDGYVDFQCALLLRGLIHPTQLKRYEASLDLVWASRSASKTADGNA